MLQATPRVSRVYSSALRQRATSCIPARRHQPGTRTLFNLFRKKKVEEAAKEPILSQDDLFHPFSKSPFKQMQGRGEAIKKLARCPVCSSEHEHVHAHTKAQPKSVQFECPDCGWPTHCSEEHWKADTEHQKYCSRLREANEDDHDLRSGREMLEFELPGEQGLDEAISFSNWDVFWYTRGFPSIDTDRSRRHASKLLTYPMTIASVLHQHSPLMLSNRRLTPEGSRSLAALRTTLHPPPGTPETEEVSAGKNQIRIFILGARAESSLPPHVWEQLTRAFPSAHFHLFFIGLQTALPKPPTTDTSSAQTASGQAAPESPQAAPTAEPEASSKPEGEGEAASSAPTEEGKPTYLPNVYQPPTPAPIERLKRTRESIQKYGVPSYTVAYTPQLTITGMQCNYAEVHPQFQDTLDPYSDCFFFFSPGFGFPSLESTAETGEPLLQAASPTEWGPVIPSILSTKCSMFVTGFSPADVERDIRSLSTAPGVAGEFDWVITPGPNTFGSEKWEIADFDPRVMVKTNWGVWGIKGKTREVRERSFGLF